MSAPGEDSLDSSAFVALIQNAALLLVLVFVYDLLARFLRRQTLAFKLVTGVVLGAIALAVMLAAFVLPTGSSSTRGRSSSAWARCSTARCRA